eukprot:CAMPEP_0116141824 /NCGR_PEP_ID=MMETSP0329-20121206/14581_1 /TAXON_ID=697910 /ORGANISM="Pseudo-nitzschia arenysensis, Strain B593" /LENGTH=946 /DNA_ID=CAMNT_0003637019 /DNA_START=267 /DNA_END=3104 /DNA_ORIENTATION=+
MIACYHIGSLLHATAWSANQNKLPYRSTRICTPQISPPFLSLSPFQSTKEQLQYRTLRSESRHLHKTKKRGLSLSSASTNDSGSKELPTSSGQTSKPNRKNNNKNKKRRSKNKNKNKNKNNRKRKGHPKGNGQKKSSNNKNRRGQMQGGNSNRKNNSQNRNISRPPRPHAPSAKTVSELVQNVRSILNTKPGNDWRSAWSILRSEATIPLHTIVQKDDGKHITVLPVRVYHDVLESMKKEKRCWQDAIRLVRYMELGGNIPSPSEIEISNEGVADDDYNRRPWHIPLPNYEIYHTLIDCLANNGGGRKDSHDASVYWLSKMLRKLETDLQQEKQELEESSDDSSNDDTPVGITNRDRKLVRNSIQLVLSSLSKQGKWRDALQLLDYTEILSRPDRANIPLTVVQYNTVLTCLARNKQVGQCQRLLQRLQERSKEHPVAPDEISYNAVIGACASSGKWREALTVLDECYEEPDCEPNIYIYTNAMRACAKAGNSQKALSLLQVVKDKGLPVDSYCYTAVIDACAKGKQWKKALELFHEMEEKGIEPTQVTYSVTISALGNGLQWERALWLLNLMRNKGMKVNLITYNAAITALAKASKNKHSAKLSSSSASSSESTNSANVDTVDDEEMWPRAVELLKQMDEDGIQPDGFCYSSAINCCGAEGRWQEACELIETMKHGGPKSRPNKVAYTAAISACGRAGQGSKALELFQNMRDDGLAADRVAYNALFSALRVSKDADRAYELWGEICGRQSRSKTSSLATARDLAISPDIITLTDCIATLSRAGYTKKMDEVFREAVERGIVLGRSNNDLDEQWEIDLSGLPFPIARAATRYVIQNIVDERGENNNDKDNNTLLVQDMVFITGIGKAQLKRKEKSSEETVQSTSTNVLERKDRTTSLRAFLQGILETDFEPSIESVVPELAQGTVVIEKARLLEWLEEANGRIDVG